MRMFLHCVAILSACLACAPIAITTASAAEATIFPDTPVQGCRGGRAKLYDECGSQVAIFEKALATANAEGKTLLVSFGAEWCIWCHVFDAYVTGQHTQLEYTYADYSDEERYTDIFFERPQADPSEQAGALSKFFADNFILVHVESRYSKDGEDVLLDSAAYESFIGALPYIFSVKPNDEFAASFNSEEIETRREFIDWYRGYDREGLMNELRRLQLEASNS